MWHYFKQCFLHWNLVLKLLTITGNNGLSLQLTMRKQYLLAKLTLICMNFFNGWIFFNEAQYLRDKEARVESVLRLCWRSSVWGFKLFVAWWCGIWTLLLSPLWGICWADIWIRLYKELGQNTGSPPPLNNFSAAMKQFTTLGIVFFSFCFFLTLFQSSSIYIRYQELET